MPPPGEQQGLFDAQEEPPRPEPVKIAVAVPLPVALLALGNVRGLGFKSLKKLVNDLGDELPLFLEAPHATILERLEECKIPGAKKLADEIASNTAKLVQAGESDYRQLASRGVTVVPPSGLPDRLRTGISSPPLWLFVEGDASLLETRPAVAVVGTRTPTKEGLRAVSIVSQILAPYPILLVSGLAEGIDEEAHRVSLAEGVKNLAFLGHGINQMFPAKTKEVRRRIVEDGGAVVSEYLPNEHPSKSYFVERNRLQAGLADLVIPVEAKPTGGTAHTIRFARQYTRRVVGIRWNGANGIIAELERAGDTVIDIKTQLGCRQLDGLIRGLVESVGMQAYPLSRAEGRLLSEIRSRETRPEDITRLIDNLQGILKERPDHGSSEGGNLRR